MNPNCIERRDSLVAPQALHLMNDGLVYQLAEQFAERVRAETGEMDDGQLDRAFWITLGRPPSEDELRLGVRTWNQLADIWDQEKAANGRSSQDMSRHKALAAICHALMNSANFLYVD
jgi:hypothetical protein